MQWLDCNRRSEKRHETASPAKKLEATFVILFIDHTEGGRKDGLKYISRMGDKCAIRVLEQT